MIKGSLQEEDITVINICILNIGAPKYINTNRHKGRNWWEYNYSERLKHITDIKGQIFQTENQ